MEAIPTNTAIFSGRGFLPRPPNPGSVLPVPAGSVRGADELARIRTAGLVRVIEPGRGRRSAKDALDVNPTSSGGSGLFGRALPPDDLVLRTVLWLALAGVPVTADGLTASVRDRLDPGLLELLDRVDTATVSDPGGRELLSLALRRRARHLIPHPLARTQPAVAVILPDGDLSPDLAYDLDSQTWGTVIRCPASTGQAAAAALGQARRQGAVYVTSMDPELRYGPHHLADLVDALRHSGARIVHSPQRFRPWGADAWLEDDTAAVEGPAADGLPHGSLWYVEDGPEAPRPLQDGYGVHGANAVPVGPVLPGAAAALRLHRSTPAVLGWFAPPVSRSTPAERSSLPSSYFEKPRATCDGTRKLTAELEPRP